MTKTKRQKLSFDNCDCIVFQQDNISINSLTKELPKFSKKGTELQREYTANTEYTDLDYYEKLKLLRSLINSEIKRVEQSKAELAAELEAYEEQEDSFDGSTPEFNEDGECIAGDEWNYPGSPYLEEDDDIY